jgi:hypothetical protein
LTVEGDFDSRRLKLCQIYSAAILSTPIFSGMFEHFRPILQGELVSHDLVDLDLAVFEIKVDVFRGQDSGLDLIR